MSSFGDELLIDWELRMPKDPNACEGWAYRWDFAECSTSHPTSRDEKGFCTMFLTLVRAFYYSVTASSHRLLESYVNLFDRIIQMTLFLS